MNVEVYTRENVERGNCKVSKLNKNIWVKTAE